MKEEEEREEKESRETARERESGGGGQVCLEHVWLCMYGAVTGDD